MYVITHGVGATAGLTYIAPLNAADLPAPLGAGPIYGLLASQKISY
jgi:hypothetical protein